MNALHSLPPDPEPGAATVFRAPSPAQDRATGHFWKCSDSTVAFLSKRRPTYLARWWPVPGGLLPGERHKTTGLHGEGSGNDGGEKHGDSHALYQADCVHRYVERLCCEIRVERNAIVRGAAIAREKDGDVCRAFVHHLAERNSQTGCLWRVERTKKGQVAMRGHSHMQSQDNCNCGEVNRLHRPTPGRATPTTRSGI
jgi:hypothetical protein